MIKLKLREKNNLKDNSVVSQIGNDLEFYAILRRREEEQKILDAYRDTAIKQIEEQAPKVEYFTLNLMDLQG